jgi:hypothetical protein
MRARYRVGGTSCNSVVASARLFLVAGAAILAASLPARAQSAPESCKDIGFPLDGGSGQVLDGLVAEYERASSEALRDLERFGQFKKTLIECVLDTVFADFSEGAEKFGEKPRTIDLLRFLDSFKLPWRADASRVAKLRELGKLARQSAAKNRDLILYLDRAIAKGPDGLLSAHLDDCAEDYAQTVTRKIERFNTIKKSSDYAGGPLQVLVHDLLAVSLEEASLMAAGRNDEAASRDLGLKAIDELQAALRTIDDPTVVNRLDVPYFKNDFRFRIAVLRLVLGEANWPETANQISSESATWRQGPPLDHVYVRDFVRWPRTNSCTDAGSGAKSTNDKAGKLNTFFNPGQIALYLCGWNGAQGGIIEKAKGIDDYLKGFSNRDYRVYLTSSRDTDELRQLLKEYGGAIKSNAKVLDEALSRVDATASTRRSEAIAVAKRGAGRCGVPDKRRVEILDDATMQPNGTWEAGESKRVHGIYLGGFLSREEADTLAEELARILGLKEPPYIGRPKIEG